MVGNSVATGRSVAASSDATRYGGSLAGHARSRLPGGRGGTRAEPIPGTLKAHSASVRPRSRPSTSRISLPARSITLGSWVEKTNVVPRVRLSCSITSSRDSAVVEIQIRGWLVGKDEVGLAQYGARDRHPLLLAAGELQGEPVFHPLQTDLAEELRHPLPAFPARHALEHQRELRVLPRGQHRQQVVRLEDEPDPVEPDPRKLAVGERGDLLPADPDRSLGRGGESAEQVQHGRLPRTRRTRHGDELAILHDQVDAPHGLDRARFLGIDLPEVRRRTAGSVPGVPASAAWAAGPLIGPLCSIGFSPIIPPLPIRRDPGAQPARPGTRTRTGRSPPS